MRNLIDKLVNNKKLINAITVVSMTFFILVIIWGYKVGIFTSQERLNQFIEQIGVWGALVFLILQIVQVVIPIIPGGVTSIAGVVIFGPLWGTVYNYIGIVTGSYINYFLARYYGVDFVAQLIGKKKMDRYIKYLQKGSKFDKLFAIAIFIPVSPDDILCLFAGLMRMSLFRFTLVMLFAKPWSLLAYTLGGDILIKKFLLNW